MRVFWCRPADYDNADDWRRHETFTAEDAACDEVECLGFEWWGHDQEILVAEDRDGEPASESIRYVVAIEYSPSFSAHEVSS